MNNQSYVCLVFLFLYIFKETWGLDKGKACANSVGLSLCLPSGHKNSYQLIVNQMTGSGSLEL